MSDVGMFLAGVDEAGCGPLAGPVYAAAVVLDPRRRIRGLDDSKRLTPERREVLAGRIRARARAWAVAWADVAEIDRLNILEARLLAMRRAVEGLAISPLRVQVDGNRLPSLGAATRAGSVECIVGGDRLVAAISAASILAKVGRDEAMRGWHVLYPQYGFDRHKGYATREHLAALANFGPSPIHRRSFAPVRAAQQRELFTVQPG